VVSGATAPDPNDWDHHWDAYGEAAEGNPANIYRRRLLMKLLGRPVAGSTVLDIGSGQGEFALHLQREYPDLDIWGAEYSASGVERSQALAGAAGLPTRFRQVDLLTPTELLDGQQPATSAVCSEVLEHVDDPTTLLRNSLALLSPGCRLVITVPGGPRSAFDKHIGHYQHFTRDSLRKVVVDAGYNVERILRAGFPVFNVYKTAVILRGKKLIADVENRAPGATSIRGESLMKSVFDFGFRHSLDDFPIGWQMAAVVTAPGRATRS
jgi:SAM-dependent methyltransferase